MPFKQLMTDTIDVLRTDGSAVKDLKASVQQNKIFLFSKLPVHPNDLIIRRMSNGDEETFRVIDPGFYEKVGLIDAHYQMRVQKLGISEASRAVQTITYNISGNNARINQSSVDASTNVVHIDSRAVQYIASLREEIEKLQVSEQEKVTVRDVVDEVENAFRSGKPKRSVVSALLNALPHAGNIASIVSAITGLL